MKIRRIEKMPVRLDSVDYGAFFKCADGEQKGLLMRVKFYGAISYVVNDDPDKSCFVLNLETGNIFTMKLDKMVIPITSDNVELVWSDWFSEE